MAADWRPQAGAIPATGVNSINTFPPNCCQELILRPAQAQTIKSITDSRKAVQITPATDDTRGSARKFFVQNFDHITQLRPTILPKRIASYELIAEF
ncbi:MAG TPA: hypothetical protein VM864_14360 [Pyrinomonadaceae bacterium]|jgi:hypothetical protein|nr:hypothetical protein [Pyrinomonadaceae bacterium]